MKQLHPRRRPTQISSPSSLSASSAASSSSSLPTNFELSYPPGKLQPLKNTIDDECDDDDRHKKERRRLFSTLTSTIPLQLHLPLACKQRMTMTKIVILSPALLILFLRFVWLIKTFFLLQGVTLGVGVGVGGGVRGLSSQHQQRQHQHHSRIILFDEYWNHQSVINSTSTASRVTDSQLASPTKEKSPPSHSSSVVKDEPGHGLLALSPSVQKGSLEDDGHEAEYFEERTGDEQCQFTPGTPSYEILSTCNSMHEIDLLPQPKSKRRRSIQAHSDPTGSINSSGDGDRDDNNANADSDRGSGSDGDSDIIPDHFSYINSGGQRSVFRIYNNEYQQPHEYQNYQKHHDEQDPASSASPLSSSDSYSHSYFAFKTNRYTRGYNPARYEAFILDTNIMERLSASPYVANVYQACGLSQVMEYSYEGNLHSLIAKQRQRRSEIYDSVNNDSNSNMNATTATSNTGQLSPLSKLKIAYQISTGLADVQDVIGVSHNDICCHQFINIDGVYKLNDFHQAAYMERNISTTSVEVIGETEMGTEMESDQASYDQFCKIQPVYNGEQMKMYPPELVESKGSVTGGKGLLDLSKVDTYMMTNTIYFVLTNQWMYEGLSVSEAKSIILGDQHNQPQYTEIPSVYLQSTDPAIIAMVKAIKGGSHYNPSKRSTARQISNHLKRVLDQLLELEAKQAQTQEQPHRQGGTNKSKNHDNHIVRVSIPTQLSRYNKEGLEKTDEIADDSRDFWRDLTLTKRRKRGPDSNNNNNRRRGGRKRREKARAGQGR